MSVHPLCKNIRSVLAGSAVLGLGLVVLPCILRAQDDDPLFRSMQDELSRSIERLQLEGQEKPYYIGYRVQEMQGYSISGSFGALVSSEPSFGRNLAVSVRVGSYKFDNTGFLSRADLFDRLGPGSRIELTIEDNYMALRRDLWLATDKAYKGAVEQLAAKRGFLESRVEKDTLPDFSRETPATMIAARKPLDFDVANWEDLVRRVSAIAKDYPDLQKSSVSVSAGANHFYVVSSEGTRVRTAETTGRVVISLSAQAEDGLPVGRTATLYANSVDQMPTEPEIVALMKSLADEVLALRTASTLEETYIGPILLTDVAACELFQQTLVPNLSGSRLPLMEDESLGAFAGGESELLARIRRPVMPRYFSIYDDPGERSAYDVPLAGHYSFDDQGVAGQRVSIIENGVLKGLPVSRRPGKNFPRSNGHGRGLSDPGTVISNLFVEAAEGKSYDELKADLLSACKDQGLEYGVIVRHMGGASANSIAAGGISIRFGAGGATESTIAYKVWLDGREEPLRGVTVEKLNLRTLKDIMAAGRDYSVLNTAAKPHGSVSFASVPVSIVAPSLLLEEAEIVPSEEAKEKPALLTNPYFDDGDSSPRKN